MGSASGGPACARRCAQSCQPFGRRCSPPGRIKPALIMALPDEDRTGERRAGCPSCPRTRALGGARAICSGRERRVRSSAGSTSSYDPPSVPQRQAPSRKSFSRAASGRAVVRWAGKFRSALSGCGASSQRHGRGDRGSTMGCSPPHGPCLRGWCYSHFTQTMPLAHEFGKKEKDFSSREARTALEVGTGARYSPPRAGPEPVRGLALPPR
jgi:hypothetical protein